MRIETAQDDRLVKAVDEQQPGFPRARVPMAPVLTGRELIGAQSAPAPSILDVENLLPVTSGRVALARALRDAGIGQGDAVLVPSFHCESMVAPVRWLGATPLFYRVNADASTDLSHVSQLRDRYCRAILVTHYFGFPQNLGPILDLCRETGMLLIEDCAHAFFSTWDEKPLGSFGDYSIASAMKFFPVLDGGLLASSSRPLLDDDIRSGGLRFQIRAGLTPMERAVAYGRLGLLGTALRPVFAAKDSLWSAYKRRFHRSTYRVATPGSSDGGFEFDVDWLNVRMSNFSMSILKRGIGHDITRTRRANYVALHEGLADLPGTRALYADLPPEVVPLVYPLHVEHAELVFPRLKRLGVPIWRFGEYLDQQITHTTFPHTIDLSRRVLQFPCHQGLRSEEIDWLIGCIRETILAHGGRT